MTSSPDSLDTRLGRLEGLLTGLQTTLVQSQAQVASFLAKVSELEKRQVELERQMVTSDDLAQLTSKVDSLIQSDARRRGQEGQAQWALPAIAQWGALIVALLALIGTNINRRTLEQQHEHRQSESTTEVTP